MAEIHTFLAVGHDSTQSWIFVLLILGKHDDIHQMQLNVTKSQIFRNKANSLQIP